MPRIDAIGEKDIIDSMDKIPEEYRERVKKVLQSERKTYTTEVVQGEIGDEVLSDEEISSFFADTDDFVLGHGTPGEEEIVSAIFKEGLIVENSEEVEFYMNTLRGLDSTSVALGKGNEKLYNESQQLLNHWEHKDSKDIIIISLPIKYMIPNIPYIADKYLPFYVQDTKNGGLLLRPEFIKGRYNARNNSFTPNTNFYKNLEPSKQEELISEVKQKFMEMIINGIKEKPEELKELFNLNEEEFEYLVTCWYAENYKNYIDKRSSEKAENIESEIDEFNSDWNENWEDEFEDITEKLGKETEREQEDIITMDEIESEEKSENEKMEHKLLSEKDITG
ncbi:MAG: hypothetical protein IJ809_06175 [Clostridia bacterium]|nr:hypothetical protein [Clostridia bacterium]